MQKRKSVGIVGFGRFGQLLASILKDDIEVSVYDNVNRKPEADKLGVKFAGLNECASKETVILAVPISAIRNAMGEMREFLKKSSLVMDVCSVKEYPLKAMKELLPRNVEILGTHPLFGPDSVHDKAAWRWVFCPSGKLTESMIEWQDFLERKGFNVIISDPITHDKAVAKAISLPHLIGRSLEKIGIGIEKQEIATLNLERLEAIRTAAINDSKELFRDVHRYNRFANEIEERFSGEVNRILRELAAIEATGGNDLQKTGARRSRSRARISFQGEHGAYSEIVCKKFLGKETSTLPCKTFREVFLAVQDGNAEFGVVPIENSKTGDINENYDLLFEFDLKVCQEIFLRVEHCLIGHKEASLAQIRKVYSHTQAISQCESFLNSMNAEKIAVYDTAGAVAMVKDSGRIDEAAIASELAASIYGMKVIRKGIETEKDNTTRFFMISKSPAVKSAKMKTSIVFSAEHKPGSLYHCLGGFAMNSVNLTKLVSRPMNGSKWKYVFYLDFEGSIQGKTVISAINVLKGNAELVRVLGSYPRGE